MNTLAARGITEYVIPGPGKVLRGLTRQCLGAEPVIRLVATPADLDRLINGGQQPDAERDSQT